MNPFAIVGFGAVGVLVACWLLRTYTRPGPHHKVAEWLTLLSVYTAIGCLLAHVGRVAWIEGVPSAQLAFCALVTVLMGWHVVSFTRAGPRRSVIEWFSATALYLVLIALFAHLTHLGWVEGSTPALIGFGFLLLLFTAGGLVSLVNALLSLRGPSKAQQQSATH